MSCKNCDDGKAWWELVAWEFFENLGGETRVNAYCPVCKTRYTREIKETKELPEKLGV